MDALRRAWRWTWDRLDPIWTVWVLCLLWGILAGNLGWPGWVQVGPILAYLVFVIVSIIVLVRRDRGEYIDEEEV